MVTVEHLSVRLGEFALHDVSLDVGKGEYIVILGPTGAGKTVLLECIAGLVQPDCGVVSLDGTDVTQWMPERRRIGYVPQDYALFPHLNVAQNIAFGARVQGAAGEAAGSVTRLAELLGISHLLSRSPGTLSGGEQQRVALARALAIKPAALLLDEPLAALDAATRAQIADILRTIHDKTGITTIHICHSFEETMRLADRVILLNGGRVEQTAPPQDILRKPRTLFAAQFVGTENLWEGIAETGNSCYKCNVQGILMYTSTPAQGPVHVMVRPEQVVVKNETASDTDRNQIFTRIEDVQDRGTACRVRTEGPLGIQASVIWPQWRHLGLSPGDRVSLSIAPEDMHVIPAHAPETRTNYEKREAS